MALKSMTGFARADGHHGQASFSWEARSVNGRNLDLRFRLPSGLDGLEIKARALCQERLSRGNCTINLSVKRDAGEMEIRLNEAALQQAVALGERARSITNMAPPQLDTLLALRGVVEVAESEESDEARAEFSEVLMAGLATALEGLVEARRQEGARLADVIGNQLKEIAALVEKCANAAGRQPDLLKARLAEQLGRLMDGAALDPDRLHQEAVLLAAKADIQEELDRLRAHLAAAQELLAAGAPVGRKFDFLSQEFNREANTICSKAADIEISRIGVELKTVIDQLREQIQNIE